MPSWILRLAAPAIWRRVPWRTVAKVAVWLAVKGRARVQSNLTPAEQSEFWALARGSRGRPGRLSEADRSRMRTIVGKAIRG